MLTFEALTAAGALPSIYQAFKDLILALLPLSKDAVHVYVGFGSLLASVFLLRLRPTAYKALVLGLVVSLVMEALDLRDNQRIYGEPGWLGSLKDLVNTNITPFLAVLLARHAVRRDRREEAVTRAVQPAADPGFRPPADATPGTEAFRAAEGTPATSPRHTARS